MASTALEKRPAGGRGQEPTASRVPVFCSTDDPRPCITLCDATNSCSCGCEEVRQLLEGEIRSRGLEVRVGAMKIGCNGECPYGPMIGFPQKGLFYTRVKPERAREVVSETLEKGLILFDLLHIDPVKATSGSVLYDRSGFIATIDDSYCMVQTARYFLQFDEGVSCGKCVPCRVGSVELREILDGIIQGKGQLEDIPRLELVCRAMQDAPYCDFARTTSGPVVTLLKHFRSELEAHIEQRLCPARACRDLQGKAEEQPEE